MSARILAGLLALASLASLAESSPPREVFHVEDASRWGTPRQIVVPEYPPALQQRGHTGYVDFEGSVTPLHDMVDVRFKADSPESEPFVAALREVLPQWAFHPVIDDQCQPSPTPVRSRVWFELEGGKPKISVSRLSPLPTPRASTMEARFRRNVAYPSRMLREGLQAYVYAAMHVDPEGRVTAVTASVHPRSEHDLGDFIAEVEKAFKRWEFTPAPPGDTAPRRACKEVFFRLR